MNRSPRQFLAVFFALSLALLALVPSINLRADYSRVLSRDYENIYRVNYENLGYLKLHYLLDHRDEYDRLIFGSSRVRFGFDTKDLDEVLGGSWFKMEYPGGSQYQHYEYLKALIAAGFEPEEVILTIDDFDLWKRDFEARSAKEYNRRMVPLTWREALDFYWFYLYKAPGKDEWDILRGDLDRKPSRRVAEDPGAGIPADEDSVAHYKELLRLKPYQGVMANRRYHYAESLVYIQNFVRLCRTHDIPLRIAFLPSNPKTLLMRNHDDIRAFKIELVRTHAFHDFTGIFPLTRNSSMWQEMSHFRTPVGRRIAQALSRSPDHPGQFGSVANKQNYQAHLNAVDRNIRTGMLELRREYGRYNVSESLRKGPRKGGGGSKRGN